MTNRQRAYVERVESNTGELAAMSVGPCFDAECCEDYPEDCGDEGSFSWSSCGVCGCHLGGNRYVWHWLSDSRTFDQKVLGVLRRVLFGANAYNELSEYTLEHEDDACQDCVIFCANGDLPEDEYLSWLED